MFGYCVAVRHSSHDYERCFDGLPVQQFVVVILFSHVILLLENNEMVSLYQLFQFVIIQYIYIHQLNKFSLTSIPRKLFGTIIFCPPWWLVLMRLTDLLIY